MTPQDQHDLTPEQLAEMPTLQEAPAPRASQLPGMIGPFRIIRELGRGGMGVVYEAEQANPKRAVALKVMRAGMVSGAASARFEREARVLAMLHHPGIAQIYQAGSAKIDDTGEPVSYFAMERIEGDPLTAHADRHKLSTRDRLSLLAEVARAVHHAHTKGIIHRDLKPGNVLVDEQGRVKVLDFGIARLTDPDTADAPGDAEHPVVTLSETGQLIGTLAYMSPEQVGGAAADIDTRSDVFALGVIGYELLSGRLPHALAGRSIVESVRTIAEEEIKPLSSVDVRLRGDIATIIGKALEKDRDRRYQSADEFARDIERFLRDEPILARPPSIVYSLGKFVRRHKPLMAGLAVAAVTVVVMSGVAARQGIEAVHAWAEAEKQSEISGEISGFLTRMLSSADPSIARGEELSVREVVDQAAAELGSRTLAPEVEAEIRTTLGTTYASLGDYDKAAAMLQRGIDLYEKLEGPDSRVTINARRQLGFVRAESGHPDEAGRIARDAEARLERLFGPDDPDTLMARVEIARSMIEQGQIAEGVEAYRAVLDDAERVLAPDSDVVLVAMHNLASALAQAGELRQSATLARQVLETRRRVLGEKHPDTITAMNNLATTLVRLGETDKAEAMAREVLRLRREVLGDSHRATATAILNLTGILIPRGRLDEAEPLVREALDICRENLDPGHPVTLSAMNQLAYLLEDEGRLDEAEPIYRETISILERTAGRDHPEMLAPINNLASLLVRDGRPDEAEPIYRDLLARTESIVGRDHYFTGIFRSNYGECLTALGRRDDAITALTESVRVLESALGPDHERTIKAKQRLEAAEQLTK